MDILDFLSQDSYICYNKTLAKLIWVNETIIFMYFVSQYRRFENNNQLTKDWYFYKTADDIYENTGLTRCQSKLCIDKLRERWLIDYKVAWNPAKLHFKILRDQSQTLFDTVLRKPENSVKNLFQWNLKTSIKETWKLVLRKPKNYTIINNNIIIKNNKEYYSFVFDFINFDNAQIKYQINKQWEDVYFNKQYQEIDKLEKDWYDIKTIKTVLQFIKQDDFRKKNILSISKLRQKDKEWIPYIVKMISNIQNWRPKQKEVQEF